MRHKHNQRTPTAVAILGTDTLFENILARLLEGEGYEVRVLGTPHHAGALPGGKPAGEAEVVLLSPELKHREREGIVEAMKSTPEQAAIPALSLLPGLKMALLDEITAGVSWEALFSELVREIEVALTRVEVLPLASQEELPSTKAS